MLTFDLAHSIMKFMEARSEAREAYLLTCRRLEQAKGSQLYSDGMKAAGDKRAATVGDAQARAFKEMEVIFGKMRETQRTFTLTRRDLKRLQSSRLSKCVKALMPMSLKWRRVQWMGTA